MNNSQRLRKSNLICAVVTLFFLYSNAQADISLKGFSSATVSQANELTTLIEHTIDGSGLLPYSSPQYPFDAPTTGYSHSRMTGDNAWLFGAVDNESNPISLPNSGVEIELDLGATIQLDAIGFWNANNGDAIRSGDLDIGTAYYGITGVRTADLYYWDLSSSEWSKINNQPFSFSREEGGGSTLQLKEFLPVETTKLKFTLLTNFGTTLSFDGVTSADWIGFSEVAYREFTPTGVPEPGSLAMFGSVITAGAWMRWRRRRSVAG